MDAALQKALLDRVYDRRKAATLDLEKQVREALVRGDRARINLIVQQLCALLASSSPQNNHARSGGLIGLAGIGIALGLEIAPYLEQVVPPVLACFSDPDSKIRYFACESFYNIAKVCKGEILMYFNEIFDALSKLAADSELSVKNGAELLDRLLKDIVCEAAPHYVSAYQDIALIRARQDASSGNIGGEAELEVAREKAAAASDSEQVDLARNKVFSLARFVPLLAERMYVLSPFTRNYLVSWITVLDSVPDLELVHFLPAFLDGLLKYLSDPNTDVRIATHNVLADFLRECKAAARPQRRSAPASSSRGPSAQTRSALETSAEGAASDAAAATFEELEEAVVDEHEEAEEDTGADEDVWVPALEVRVDYAAITEILVNHVSYPDEEIQATALHWLSEFLLVVQDVVVPFTHRLIPAILPSIAHHSPAIQSAANATNTNLFRVLQELPVSVPPPTSRSSASVQGGDARAATTSRGQPSAPPASTLSASGSSTTTASRPHERVETASSAGDTASSRNTSGVAGSAAQTMSPQLSPRAPPRPFPTKDGASEAADAATAPDEETGSSQSQPHADALDLHATVNVLTLQLIDEHEETRVAALEWLLMLHQKAPHKILAMDDGTFPALLKTLSDPSEEVIRSDLRLLAQISSASEERNDAYFRSFMVNLVSLFSTDRRLLETRGSLILRQLCASLHTERIFRTLAEILERDEDLEFASVMVTNMNMILITSPELADFRRRLKNLDSRDGQQLFASLYRSWCHNAVATFSLCLLAQAYEHASNLLQIFAELEITVALLIQIDKLVQLLESPIFTALRLQLLEPERHPYLFKCMYGLLMLLPQSSAFATLRNRLNAVSSMGFLHVAAPRSLYGAGNSSGSGASGGSLPSGAAAGSGNSSTGPRSKLGSRDDIKWNELLTHFRKVQARHEQARRAGGLASGLEADGSLVPGMARASLGGSPGGAGALRGPLPASRVGSAGSSRRKASGASAHPPGSGSRFGMGSATAPASSSSGSKLASAPASSSFFGLHLSGGASSAAPGPSVPSGTSRPTSPISARKGQPRNVSAQFATKR